MKKQTISIDMIDHFLGAGRVLIPIKVGDKVPRDPKWTTREYDRAELVKHAERGGNLGWRLGPCDLVIDVDQKAGGLDALPVLAAEVGDDLAALAPTVITGGGGYHFYFNIPNGDPAAAKYRETIERYPGIEFKTAGRQVVIPGSTHPNGTPYDWDHFSPLASSPPAVPSWLLDRLARRDVSQRRATPTETITPESLKTDYLDKMPVDEYRSHDLWFAVFAASYHATVGRGLDVFVDWSIKDPKYAHDGSNIRLRWKTLANSPTDDTRGLGTLRREVLRYSDPTASAVAEFSDAPDLAPIDFIADAKAAVALVDSKSLNPAIRRAVRLLSYCDPLEQKDLLKDLATTSGRTVRDLAATLKDIKQNLKEARKKRDQKVEKLNPGQKDVAERVAEELLDASFAGGDHLLHGVDQAFWKYSGTHWLQEKGNMITRAIYRAACDYRDRNKKSKFQISHTIGSAQKILIAKTATDRDLFCFEELPPSCINTVNKEIWIEPLTGAHEPRDHRFDSYLTSCLPIEYDPGASCPTFNRWIRGLFKDEKDVEELVRHVIEIWGYTIQPRKNIPIWVLCFGRGENGKSTFLRILGRMLEGAALEQSLGQFDTTSNAHALADLPGKLAVIDEDFKTDGILPADFLKKVSENKMLVANPKRRDAYRFASCATVFLASNKFPRSRDFTEGMRRRAVVLPFRRQFTKDEIDESLERTIVESELPGVLNLCLDGLARLRKRGRFKAPLSCIDMREEWITETNQIKRFISHRCEEIGDARTPLKDLWADYLAWASDEGITRTYTQPAFRAALMELGHIIEPGTNNLRFVKGLIVKDDATVADFK